MGLFVLRFIHLSDIHFDRRLPDFGADPDTELRERMLADIASMRAQLGKADAILVSGDVAYAGKKDEYETAGEWLDTACEAAGCRADAVWLAPGNHDIDQTVLSENPLIADGHDSVRSQTSSYLQNRKLEERLMQPRARDLFYEPLRAYNEFAARYGSSFAADKESYFWEQDYPLDDGSILRLRGLNTALMSGKEDREGSLFLGLRATTFSRKDGVEYLSIAHHPPSWLLDKSDASKAFDSEVRIQLFGHEHDARIAPGRDEVKVFAGSVNPHRAETGWQPGYNVIEISTLPEPERTMRVDVHARTWQGHPPQFRALQDKGGEAFFRSEFMLDKLAQTWRSPWDREDEDAGSERVDTKGEAIMVGEKPAPTTPDFRSLVYRFFRLNLSQKNEIVGRMKLVLDEDADFTGVERFKRQLCRARAREKLAQLAELVNEKETEA